MIDRRIRRRKWRRKRRRRRRRRRKKRRRKKNNNKMKMNMKHNIDDDDDDDDDHIRFTVHSTGLHSIYHIVLRIRSPWIHIASRHLAMLWSRWPLSRRWLRPPKVTIWSHLFRVGPWWHGEQNTSIYQTNGGVLRPASKAQGGISLGASANLPNQLINISGRRSFWQKCQAFRLLMTNFDIWVRYVWRVLMMSFHINISSLW